MALKQKYVPEDHEGKLYRVRDKDLGKGQPIIVWGSHLPHELAHKLKERVCGRALSNSARIEDMTIPLVPNAVTPRGQPLTNEPPPGLPRAPSSLVTPRSVKPADPMIAAAQAKAMAAARAPAAQAQQRSDNLIPLPQHAHNDDGKLRQVDIDTPEAEIPGDIDDDLESLIEGDAVAE